MSSPFSAAHRLYVKSLYKRMLKNEMDWVIRYDLFKPRALAIRAEFERNRDVSDPRALADIIGKAEADLDNKKHPDPYIPAPFPGGTKWERNVPVLFSTMKHIIEKFGAPCRQTLYPRSIAANVIFPSAIPLLWMLTFARAIYLPKANRSGHAKFPVP